MDSSVLLRYLLMSHKLDLNNNDSLVLYEVCVSSPVEILITKDRQPSGTCGDVVGYFRNPQVTS